jgi:predicted SAM-dependent methyltransferase
MVAMASSTVGRVASRVRAGRSALLWGTGLAPEVLPRLAYRLLLRRPIDPGALESWKAQLREDPSSMVSLVTGVVTSAEFSNLVRNDPHVDRAMLHFLHRERCRLVRDLPPAKRIVDLGGAVPHDNRGALLHMGYPHDFELMTVVDVPPGESHEQVGTERHEPADTPQGRVEHRYVRMADLDAAGVEDDSVDLFWMGQSIEHITPEECAELLPRMLRKLRPGGQLWLDTPNRRVTAVQYPDHLIHPDHKLEYEPGDLAALVRAAGFVVDRVEGIGRAVRSVETGRFDAGEVTQNIERNPDADDSYVFVLVAHRPTEGEGEAG